MTDKLPIPESVRWLRYDGEARLVLVRENLPADVEIVGSSVFDELELGTQRFLAAVVRMEFLDEAERYENDNGDFLLKDRIRNHAQCIFNAATWKKARGG